MKNNDIKNINEAKAQVKVYRKLTIEDIHKIWNIKKKFNIKTDFDVMCLIINRKCKNCIFSLKEKNCLSGYFRDTYITIKNCKTPEDLLNALYRRANILETLIDEVILKNNE